MSIELIIVAINFIQTELKMNKSIATSISSLFSSGQGQQMIEHVSRFYSTPKLKRV